MGDTGTGSSMRIMSGRPFVRTGSGSNSAQEHAAAEEVQNIMGVAAEAGGQSLPSLATKRGGCGAAVRL